MKYSELQLPQREKSSKFNYRIIVSEDVREILEAKTKKALKRRRKIIDYGELASLQTTLELLAKLGPELARNEEKFKKIRGKIREIKCFQTRVFGWFSKWEGDNAFICAVIFKKKRERAKQELIKRAELLRTKFEGEN